MNTGSGLFSKRAFLFVFVAIFILASLGGHVFFIGVKQNEALTNAVLRLKQNEALSDTVLRLSNVIGSNKTKDNNNQGIYKYTMSQMLKYENDFEPMDDPGLIRYIQQRYLVYPTQMPADLKGPEEHTAQVNQSQYVDKLLKGKRNGFFVEAGAHNGIFLSNTYFFEKYRGWTGLLMEPNTEPFQNILRRRQGSYAVNACIGTAKKVQKVNFFTTIANEYSMISYTGGKSGVTNVLTSIPVYTILKAIEVDTVDFFSLDIEGLELDVLKTIPWDKMRVNVFAIEYRAAPGTPDIVAATKKRENDFKEFFAQLGIYDHVTTLSALDLVFARKDLK